jgi:hypothetical protein
MKLKRKIEQQSGEFAGVFRPSMMEQHKSKAESAHSHFV